MKQIDNRQKQVIQSRAQKTLLSRKNPFVGKGKEKEHLHAPEGKHSEGEAPSEPHPDTTVHRDSPKIGRNDPCPCGSGKKYKKCCLNSQK